MLAVRGIDFYAMLEPVDIGGVIVRQATLHNFDYISEKDIRIGDRVKVKRAGEVIPYVIGPVEALRNGEEIIFQPPSTCPDCGEPAEHLAGEVAWYCVNSACPAQLIRTSSIMCHGAPWISLAWVYGLWSSSWKAGWYMMLLTYMRCRKRDLLGLEGFAEKKAENLLQAIETPACKAWRA